MATVVTPNRQHGSTLATEPLTLAQYADLCQRTGNLAEEKAALAKMGAKDWYEADLLAAKNARWREDYVTEKDFYERALIERPGDVHAKQLLERAERDAARLTSNP